MQKFFVLDEQIENGNVNIIGEDVNHISNVLRLKENENILVSSRTTAITYNCCITNIFRDKVTCKIENILEETTESNACVTIFQGLPKAEKMEYIIQKTTELGAIKIVPVNMKRCIVKLNEKDEKKKIERWQKIAEVAAKQSKRDIIPKIEKIMNISDLQSIISDFDLFLVAYEDEKNNKLKNILKNVSLKKKTKIGVVIGPEGGLEESEVEKLKQNGAKIVSLGNRILRTETAPVAILSNIVYEFDL